MASPIDGYLWDRIYKLTVGKPATSTDIYKEVVRINPEVPKRQRLQQEILLPIEGLETEGDENTLLPVLIKEQQKVGQKITAGSGIEITELKVEATISRSLTSLSETSDSTEIKVYNLSPESKAVLETPNAVVMLEAGYAGTGLSLLYSGTVIKCVTVKQGQDKITTLYCQDGGLDKKATKVAGDLPKGTTVKQAIVSLIDALPGVAAGKISSDAKTDFILYRGYSVQGYAKTELDKICRNYGLIWYVENGVVNVAPNKLTQDSPDIGGYKARAVEITPDYIKGSLEPMIDMGTAMSTEPSKAAVRFQTFLEPRLTLDSYVALRGFPDYDGDYRVVSVSHSLDSRGGAWDTTVETERVG